MKDTAELVRSNILRLSPYSTARDEYKGRIGIFLDANESPYPGTWNRYPDPHQQKLKERIALLKGVCVENLFLGNGSDEAIDLLFRVFCTPGKDNAVAIAPSYGMYGVSAAINDVQMRSVRLGPGFSLPAERLVEATDSDSKLLFLCSPNNPTGNAFLQEELAAVIRSFPGIVVLDEAYADFSAKGSMVPRLAEFPNLVILQTFSKAYGLAGLRLGIAIAAADIIGWMSQVKYPYNLSQSTQKAALAALKKPVGSRVREICEQRERLASRLGAFPFIRKVWPSDANFLLIESDDADRLYDYLLKAGIIVRNRSHIPGCEGCLRITVGLPEENRKLTETLKNYPTANHS